MQNQESIHHDQQHKQQILPNNLQNHHQQQQQQRPYSQFVFLFLIMYFSAILNIMIFQLAINTELFITMRLGL